MTTPTPTLEALRARDPVAIEALVHAHHRRLRGYVAVLSADVGAVDDLSQEVFVRAIERIARVEDIEAFDRFLKGIARNVVHEHRRAKRRAGERYAALVVDDLVASEAIPVVDDRLASLRRCIAALGDRARRLLTLRYVEDLAAADIAAAVEMRVGTVRVALLRARETLEKCLNGAREDAS